MHSLLLAANEGKTLLPYADFKCESDCEKLHDAMKGFGTDEKTIIEILGHRSKGQTQEIISMYQQMFGKDLIEELKGELSGSFKTVIVGLCQPQSDFDAQQLRKAMKGLGTDEQCLIDILCTRTNAEIHDIIQAYKRLHKRDLKDDVASESSGDFRRLLISVLNANRSEETEVDIAQVRQDAKDLYEAGEASLGTDESVYNRVLCLRSYDQLMAVFGEYQSITGRDIEESIESELSGDLKRGMMAVATSVRSVAGYFADALYESMSGLGTSDDRLIRICVSRCEIDMVQIKKEFKRKYGQPLADMIVGDISGDYKKIILAIIGEEGYN
ncbi:hypothetical protein CAPTEDRAFT_225672 [Capitella teleta]|uniref:Annexin n=1 Tax=Capitella teleta TaxID=283909 RepID=R7UGC2_CAPTE|nr:hypothetical protein CAPTEDRAFT_225672 [Capitella teleta]|eukprot:ELU05270.1 hypothetical protein CAPTEDRAFT_225672 [Capitella teleta]